MLAVRDLECARGGRSLFSGIGFSLSAGDLMRVRGPNGSGKTTLLRTLAGLTRAESGTVLWDGTDVAGMGDEFRARLAYLGHQPALKDELTVSENVRYAAWLGGTPAEDAEIAPALERVGLGRRANLPARFLSQGQRRRVAIARLALAARLPLWILDEPFTALDADAVAMLRALLREHLGAGGEVVLTTHQESELEGLEHASIGLESR